MRCFRVAIWGIFFAHLLVLEARSETLLRYPLNDHAGYSSWFDHDARAGYMRRYDGSTTAPRDEHHGTDMLGNMSPEVIYAAGSGSLYQREDRCDNNPDPPCGSGYGNHVRIEHASGKITIYAHMLNTGVAGYQSLLCGASVGYMGNSGNSRGTHLHFEMRSDRFTTINRIDPFGGPWSNGGFSYWVSQNGAGTGNPSTQCQ